MKVIKLLQTVCILGAIFSIAGIDQQPKCWVTLLFFIISYEFFTSYIRVTKKEMKLQNDLYERSNY